MRFSFSYSKYSTVKENKDADIFKENTHFIYNPEVSEWKIGTLNKLLEKLNNAEE